MLTDSSVHLRDIVRASFMVWFGNENKKYKLRKEKHHVVIILELFTFDSETDCDAAGPTAHLP